MICLSVRILILSTKTIGLLDIFGFVLNKEKKAKLTDLTYTLTQLRCAGVMSAVTISRAAFSNRMALETALSRFEYLIRGRDEGFNDTKMQSNSPLQEKVSVLLDTALKGQESLADDGVTVEKNCYW